MSETTFKEYWESTAGYRFANPGEKLEAEASWTRRDRIAREELAQSTARIAELEKQVKDLQHIIDEENKDHIEQQAIAQADNVRLREALKDVEVVRMHYEESCQGYFTCPSCEFNKGYAPEVVKHDPKCALNNALSQPLSTSALDAYVAKEKAALEQAAQDEINRLEDQKRKLEQEKAELQAKIPAWQDIETALPEIGVLVMVSRGDATWVNKYLGDGKWFSQIPTHWMPLSPSPDKGQE